VNSSKKKKTLIILLASLAALCAVIFIVSRVEEKKENIKNSGELLLAVSPEDVTSLSFEYGELGLSFHKDGRWLWDDDDAFPVDESAIHALLSPFTSLSASFVIESPDDLSQYGLSDPEAVIRFSDSEDHEIRLGALSAMDQERYLSLGDGNVYLVTEDPLSCFDVKIENMILNDVISTNVMDAKSITVSGAANCVIELEEDSPLTYCDEDLYFMDGKPLDNDLITAYLSTVACFSLSSYVTYNVTEEELTLYGLKEPELTLTLVYPEETGDDGETGDKTLVLNFGRNQDELKEAGENPDEDLDVTCYLRVGDSQIIYPITEAAFETLSAVSYDDLRHRELFTGQWSDLTSIDIALEGENYTLFTAPGEEDDETVAWHYTGDEEQDMGKFESALYYLKSYSFTDEEPSGKEEIRLVLHQDNENFPTVELAFYRVDGFSCLAEVDGEITSLVTRSLVVDLIEAVNEIVLK